MLEPLCALGSSAGTLLEPPFSPRTPAGTPARTPLSAVEPTFVRFWSFLGIQHGPLAFQPRCVYWPPWSKDQGCPGCHVHSGLCGPQRLGCTDLTDHPDTKVVIPPGTTIARIRLTCPLFAAEKQPCALTDRLHGVLEDNPEVPILQVKLHAEDVDDVISACTGRANPTVNKTQRHHVGMEGTTLLFAAHKPTTKKVGKDNYPFKHSHLDTLRNVVDSKPARSLPNYSLTSHSPYHLKTALVGLTTLVIMESEDLV